MAKEKKRAGRKNDIALIKGIQRVLSKAGRKGLTQRELATALKMKKDEAALSAALKKALAEGSVIQKKGRYLLAESRDLHPALYFPFTAPMALAGWKRRTGMSFCRAADCMAHCRETGYSFS